MNWNTAIKQKRKEYPKRMPKLKRVKAGKIIIAWALIPANLCFWMLPIGSFMATGIKPTVWARGRLNERKGNGDLILL